MFALTFCLKVRVSPGNSQVVYFVLHNLNWKMAVVKCVLNRLQLAVFLLLNALSQRVW